MSFFQGKESLTTGKIKWKIKAIFAAESHDNVFIINVKLYMKTHVSFNIEKDSEIY